uniref:Replication-associated protein n=1 Tax=Redondovirus D_HF5_2R TaxID=3071205 RepID=A0AA50KK71_9VIRU|nr:replication associated protein [Redondovirus D_HF5_2R]
MSLHFNGQNIFLTFNDANNKLGEPAELLDKLRDAFAQYEPAYSVCGKETAPTTNMKHFHVFIHLKKRLQSRKFEEFITVQGVRPQIEKVHNNIANIIKYCKKEGHIAEKGADIWTKKGTLNKKEKAELILNGDLEKLFMEGTLGPVEIIRAYKIRSIFETNRKPTAYKKKLVMWFKGPTGEGKTRTAVKIAEEYFKNDYWISNETLKWFDNYNGQEIAIIDDFRKSMITDWSFLLRILDGYSLIVQIKGGFVRWCPKVIIITSPASPEEAFSWINKEGETMEWDKQEQLKRRLTHNDEYQLYEFPLWEEESRRLENTIRKEKGIELLPDENAFISEEYSAIAPETFVTPG